MQLDRYRRQVSPAIMFNGASFLWLFLGTIFSLSLINYAVIKIEPDQFGSDRGDITLLAMTLYSFATLVLQEAGGVHALGDLAQAIQLAAAFLGLVVILGFVANIVISARRERSEGELRNLVRTLRRRARDEEAKFRASYSVSTDEAYQRLLDLQTGAAFLLRFFAQAIPEDFEDFAADESPG